MIDNLVTVNCPTCTIVFAMPKQLFDLRQKDGESFYCPSGHKLHYGDNETAKLEKRINDLKEENVYLAETISELRHQVVLQMRRVAGYKGQWMRARAAAIAAKSESK